MLHRRRKRNRAHTEGTGSCAEPGPLFRRARTAASFATAAACRVYPGVVLGLLACAFVFLGPYPYQSDARPLPIDIPLVLPGPLFDYWHRYNMLFQDLATLLPVFWSLLVISPPSLANIVFQTSIAYLFVPTLIATRDTVHSARELSLFTVCWTFLWVSIAVGAGIISAPGTAQNLIFGGFYRKTRWHLSRLSCRRFRQVLRHAQFELLPRAGLASPASDGPSPRRRPRASQRQRRRARASRRQAEYSRPSMSGGSGDSSLPRPRRRRTAERVWADALHWLSDTEACTDGDSEAQSQRRNLVSRCRSLVGKLPRDMRVAALSRGDAIMTTTLLVDLLGSHWLHDEHIMSGHDYIARELSNDCTVLFLSCFLLEKLREYRKAAVSGYNPRRPQRWDLLVRSGKFDTLVIPVNIDNLHWTRLVVNLEFGTIEYMDPMRSQAKPPKQVFDNVTWWLATLCPGISFSLVSSATPHAGQQDSDSCGVAVLSASAGDFLNYEYWTQDTWREHRMNWFLRLAGLFADDELHPPPAEETSDSDDEVELLAKDPACAAPTLAPTPPAPGHPLHTTSSPTPVVDRGAVSEDWEALEDSDQPLVPLPWVPQFPRAGEGDDGMDLDLDYAPDAHSASSDDDTDDQRKPIGASRKRTGPSSSSAPPPKRRKLADPGAKASTSYQRQQALKQQSTAAKFQPHIPHLRRFRQRIRSIDPGAEFENKTWRSVRCSRCASWIKMRMLYECDRFVKHRATKSCTKHKGTQTSITGFFSRVQAQPAAKMRRIVCPGLSTDSDPRIEQYLQKSSALGGGAPSRVRLAFRLFECTWADLSLQQEDAVKVLEEQSFKWLNRRGVRAVFSADCLRTVDLPITETPKPCANCHALLNLKTFKNALKRPAPDDTDLKYTPHDHRSTELGLIYSRYSGVRDLVERNTSDRARMLLEFVQGVLRGTFAKQEVLLGAIRAMMEKARRGDLGKTTSGMRYDPDFDNFCSILATISPRAYRLFQAIFGGRTIRSQKVVNARADRFLPGITTENIASAAAVILSYKYTGPVVLACDDTKLEPALREMVAKDGTWMVVGQTGETRFVSEESDIADVLKESTLEMGTKLRLWVLIIPVPKVPPIILAAEARSESDSADDLYQKHCRVSDLLRDHQIFPIAYASDGTETERKMQRMIYDAATVRSVTIGNARPGFSVPIDIAIVHGHPQVVVQDSMHGIKTARNQLFSGARILSLGNFPLFYSQMVEAAQLPDSPLFRRDVSKVDRQEDRAAARVFSAEFLNHQIVHFPQRRGIMLYLFFLGGLFDAWQSRHLPHHTRALLALRCRFFLMSWAAHVRAHPDHAMHRNFISRESHDIFLTMCDSLLGLILLYREYHPEFPLLPWLHSTEPLEHTFGVLRQLKPDFTFFDFLTFIPRLAVYLMGAFGVLSDQEKANRTAAGYWHHDADDTGMDLHALMQWPSDSDLASISERAAQETISLMSLVGIDAAAMLAPSKSSKSAPKARRPAPSAPVQPSRRPKRSCPSLCRVQGGVHDYIEKKKFNSLQDLLKARDALPFQDSNLEKSLDTAVAAAAAAELYELQNIEALPTSDPGTQSQTSNIVHDFLNRLHQIKITASSATTMPSTMPPQLTIPAASTDFSSLVSDRAMHQNAFTREALRIGRNGEQESQRTSALKAKVAQHLQEVMGNAVVSNRAGYARAQRWTGQATGDDSERRTEQANADSDRAQRVARARHGSFKNFTSYIHPLITSGNVSSILPLDVGSHSAYVLFATTAKKPRLAFGKVLTMYTSIARRHAPIDSALSLAAPSYISVQVFARFGTARFTSMSCAALDCTTFQHLPPSHIIMAFTSYAIQETTDESAPADALVFLTPDSETMAILRKAQDSEAKLLAAVKSMKKALKSRTTTQKDASESEDDNDRTETDDGGGDESEEEATASESDGGLEDEDE